MVLGNDFLEMNPMELEEVNGGDGLDAFLVGAGTVAAAWAIPVGVCCTPVGCVMALFGAAAVLVGCGVDIELIEY